MDFLIPLTTTPQTFEIDLADKSYQLTCKFNPEDQGGWVLDWADAITGESIYANMPLVTGVNLLSGLAYLGFGGALYVYTDSDPLAVPTADNLGVESNLYFTTEATS